MLKRQRPVSPVPSAPEVPLIPADSIPSHRDFKRRRTLAPTLDGTQRGVMCNPFSGDGADDEEDEDEDEDSSQHNEHGANDWHDGVGNQYKTANSFLHNLHAEHQHRLLFSSNFSPHSTLPNSKLLPLPVCRSPEPMSKHGRSAYTDNGKPALLYPSSGIYGRNFMLASSSEGTRLSNDVDPLTDELRRVRQQYEERNRRLGSLFLSRRRETSSNPDEQ